MRYTDGWQAVTSLVGGPVFAAAMLQIFKLIGARRKERSDARRDDDEESVELRKLLGEEIAAHFARQSAEIKRLGAEVEKCDQDRAADRTEFRAREEHLLGRIRSLEAEVRALRNPPPSTAP